MKVYNVAIDGPAGAGKSTVARMAAEALGFIYVDTGSMYRALALAFLRRGIEPADEARIREALGEIDVTLAYQDGEQAVLLNGENVNAYLRTQEVGSLASAFSPLKPVRAKLLSLQRELAGRTSVVMDGRDIGTVVLPDADVKIYLTADAAVRAKRRCLELSEKGLPCDEDAVKKEIIARDEQDMTRAVSPLKKAEDAILLDASSLTAQEVAAQIVQFVKTRCAL